MMIAQPANLPIPSPTASPVTVPPIQENTIDLIVTLLQQLAPEQQQYVLDFVEFLVQKYATPPTMEQQSEAQPPEHQDAEPTIWEKLRNIMAEVPDEEWAKVPTDGSYQHDHYLYGTPKREL